MLRPLLKLNDYTVTHFTPCDRIRALTKRMGFVDLNLQMKVLLPLQFPGIKRSVDPENFVYDDEMVSEDLMEHDQKIFLDHQPYQVGNLLVQEGDEYCYILYTHVIRYRVNYCHIHYISNRKIYAEKEHPIRTSIMKKHGVRFVVIDARSAGDINFRRSFDFWAPSHAVYRPQHGITPQKVDSLYSDVVMLRLAILPHISHELKEVARRWLHVDKRT